MFINVHIFMSQPFIFVVKPKSNSVTYLNMKTLIKKPFFLALIIFVSAFLLTKTSFAYLSLSETGELIKEGDYRVGVVPQLLLANGGGNNMGVFFDMPVESDINSRFMIGGGNTDFWTSASVKWVPYPDYEKQPAIGLRGSFTYARDGNANFYDLQATPIISKQVSSQWGRMIPYVGLPITIVHSTISATLMQFVIGTEWVERKDFQVGGELDLNLSNTTTALTLHVNFPFDGNTGFRQ